jgi:HemK-like putative methylase
MPLQYILGSQPFGELDIKCIPGVLIPRWETEEWTIRLVRLLAGLQLNSIDVCTGSGCIALLIKKRLNIEVKGVDISDSAISLSKENNIRHSLDVEFIKRDVFSWRCEEQYDLVTSNPPYIPQGDYESNEIERSVVSFEPRLALVGWNEFYDALMHNVVIPSNAQGFVFELGYREQYEFTKSILPSNWECKLYNDSAGKERCVIGWVKGGKLEQLQRM